MVAKKTNRKCTRAILYQKRSHMYTHRQHRERHVWWCRVLHEKCDQGLLLLYPVLLLHHPMWYSRIWSPIRAMNRTVSRKSVTVPWSLSSWELFVGQVLPIPSLWRRTCAVLCASSPQLTIQWIFKVKPDVDYSDLVWSIETF